MEPEQQTNSNGALVGSIVIIIILILGGLYLLKTNMDKEPVVPTTEDTTTGTETQTQSNTTTDTTEVEAELNTMDLESLDSEI